MISRRHFFSSFAVLGLGIPKAAPPADVDELTYRGWTIRWLGWRTPTNQIVSVGVWYTYRDYSNPVGWYATTHGVTRECREFDAIDFTRYGRMPGLTVKNFATEAPRQKQEALNRLKAVLEMTK